MRLTGDAVDGAGDGEVRDGLPPHFHLPRYGDVFYHCTSAADARGEAGERRAMAVQLRVHEQSGQVHIHASTLLSSIHCIYRYTSRAGRDHPDERPLSG